MKKRSAMLTLLLAILLAVPAHSTEKAPWGVLVSWVNCPAESVAVTWMDSGAWEESLQIVSAAEYALTGFDSAAQFAACCEDVSLDGSGVWRYEAVAEGLEPGTEYVYRVGREGAWSACHTCRTDDPEAGSLTFAYLGDAQPSGDSGEDYASWGELVEEMYRRTPELAFALLGGDLVNSGISLEEFGLLRQAAEPVFSSVPLFAAAGNHESNFLSGKPELLLELFAFPQNGPEGFQEEFYSFDAGNCHILVVNSWIFSGEQSLTAEDVARINAWIAADLAMSTADWQIVVTHVPVYPVQADATADLVQANWAPIFEQYGVDLVLEGHQHVYSRSYPMYQGHIDYENGIPYIMGVSGSKFYDSADETFAARTIYGTSNYQLIRTAGDAMTVQCLDAAGNELDFTTVLQREIDATRGEFVEVLWQAAGSPEPEGSDPFQDTNAKAAAWAWEQGLLLGYGNGMAGWEDPLESWQRELIIERIGGEL